MTSRITRSNDLVDHQGQGFTAILYLDSVKAR